MQKTNSLDPSCMISEMCKDLNGTLNWNTGASEWRECSGLPGSSVDDRLSLNTCF